MQQTKMKKLGIIMLNKENNEVGATLKIPSKQTPHAKNIIFGINYALTGLMQSFLSQANNEFPGLINPNSKNDLIKQKEGSLSFNPKSNSKIFITWKDDRIEIYQNTEHLFTIDKKE